MNNIRKIVAALLVLAFTIFIAGCGSKSVAKVNGEKITQEQLDKRMKKVELSYKQQGANFDGEQGKMMLEAIKQQVLDEMINQSLIMQAAKNENMVVSDDEVNSQYAEIIKRFGGQKQFDDAMKTYGYTEQELKDKLRYDASFGKLYDKITKDVKITDEEVKKYYDDNPSRFKEPEKIKVRHILVALETQDKKTKRTDEQAKQEAQKIYDQLKSGADFDKLAKEKSDDTGSKDKGGLLTDRMGNEMVGKGTTFVQEFDAAAFALKPGEISKPVKTQFGYHIIKVEAKTSAKQKTFEEAKDQIKKDLPNYKKQDVFNKYIEDLRSKAKIENNLAKENPISTPGGTQGGSGSGQGQLPANHPKVDDSANKK